MQEFNQERFRQQVREILKGYKSSYDQLVKPVEDEIIKRINNGDNVSTAVSGALADTSFFAVTKKSITDAMYLSACAGYGILPNLIANPSEDKIREKLLSESWTGDKMNLSERLHGTKKVVKQRIVDTISSAMRKTKPVKEMARDLYDGYNSGKGVINKADLPEYLKSLRFEALKAARGDKKMTLPLEKAIGLAEYNIEKLTSRELKAAYKAILDAAKKFQAEALIKSTKVALEEKTRYYAERIARTESVRAWFDGFIAENQDDPDVWGYKWVLSGKHHLVGFDQCDLCANMDVGFGKGIYPKSKVPSIPRHPHCMCMLEIVYEWEVDKNSKFDANKAREYIDSLDKNKKVSLFGRGSTREHDKDWDWQKHLKDWDGFGQPKSRLAPIEIELKGNEYKEYKESEIYEMADAMNEIAGQYAQNISKWSGKLNITDGGYQAKMWNCSISLRFQACNHLILHEMLHARSVSYYDKKTYGYHNKIEEASVQLLNQEISKNKKILIIDSDYDDNAEILRKINRIAKLYESDLDFATALFNIPLPKRLEWLEDKVYENMMQAGNFEDYQNVNELINHFA